MSEPIKKEDLKEVFIESLEPFAGAIKKDFDRVDERFNKVDEEFERIGTTLIAIVEDLKEARKERQELKARINETYNAVDGFIKVVDKLETEFTVIKEDLKRIKEVIKEKLGVDLF
jgi:chromosome segregation ATPase